MEVTKSQFERERIKGRMEGLKSALELSQKNPSQRAAMLMIDQELQYWENELGENYCLEAAP